MVWPTFTGLAKYGGSSNWVTPTYADVVALFGSGSCSGYLKNDGTCSTTSGMVWPSSPGYALWQSGSSWSTPSLTDSGGNVNSSEPIVVNASSVASQLSLTYNTGHALVPGSSTTAVYGVDASGNAVGSEAGGAASRFCTATNGICSGSGGTEQLASSRSLVSSDCGQIIRLGGYSLTLPNPQPANPCSFTVQAAGAGVVVLGSGATYNGLSTAPTLSCNDQLIRISATSGSTTDYVGDAGVAAGSNTTLTCSSYQIAVNAAPVSTIISSGAITVTAQNTYVYCTGNCTITPLAPALNVQLCVRNGYDTDAVVTLAALGSGKSYELIGHTTLGTPNHTVVSGGGGYDESCWLGVSTTAYSNWNSSGTWTD
jgi:hypothetical protein